MDKISQLLKRYGIIKFILLAMDEIVHSINRFLRERLYHWTKDEFGFKEAIFWSKDIDQYLRYSKMAGELKKIEPVSGRKIRLLEVGAGGEGIAKFLKYAGDSEKYDICLSDKDSNSLSNVKLGKPIVIEAATLPFADNEFDVVISVDTLEHIPKSERPKFIEELKRVSNTVLLHFPMHDPQNQYLARDIDFEFNKWYLKYFKKESSWTVEHLSIESPTCSEILNLLPGASITGTQNINIWFKYITLSAKPLIGFFTGFAFIYKWEQNYYNPPFHGCYVKWNNKAL